MIMMLNQDASMMDPTWLNIIMTFVIVIFTIIILILVGTEEQWRSSNKVGTDHR